MAWEKCPWCKVNLNGYYAQRTHKRKAHPTEYALAEAGDAVAHAVKSRDGAESHLAEYRILTAYLEGTMPELVRDILDDARHARAHPRFFSAGSSLTNEDVLVAQLAAYEDALTDCRAALTALEQKE